MSAIVSLESVLSTYNVTEAIDSGGKASSSSRAGLLVWVEVDGVKMMPATGSAVASSHQVVRSAASDSAT